jgi:membrane protein DedA with SNARE-associated domain
VIDQILQYFDVVLQSSDSPFYLMAVLIGISFLLEDVAAAAGVALATVGKLSWIESFAAVAFGIAFGDTLLFGLGRLCRKIPFLKKRYIDGAVAVLPFKSNLQLAGVIFISRVTPGLRLVSYVYMGFIQVAFPIFLFWVTTAVMIWTASLYLISVLFGRVIASSLGIPIGFATALPLLILALGTFILAKLSKRKKN